MESENWEKETAIGLVRISDLIFMKFKNEGESYIDILNKRAVILAEKTKNGSGREIKLSEQFIEGIKQIYDNQIPEWLISTKEGKPYKTPNGVRKYIVQAFGYSPKTIRAMYATYLHDLNIPMPAFRRICDNMGHSHQTSVVEYVHKNTHGDD